VQQGLQPRAASSDPMIRYRAPPHQGGAAGASGNRRVDLFGYTRVKLERVAPAQRRWIDHGENSIFTPQ